MNFNNLSLEELETEAYLQQNELAILIHKRSEENVEEAVQSALNNDSDNYSYEVFDAAYAVTYLFTEAQWIKDEKKSKGDFIHYEIDGLHEDTNPYNNHISLIKSKNTNYWTLTAMVGQYGEEEYKDSFTAKGFKDAQQKATLLLADWIKRGAELNLYL